MLVEAKNKAGPSAARSQPAPRPSSPEADAALDALADALAPRLFERPKKRAAEEAERNADDAGYGVSRALGLADQGLRERRPRRCKRPGAPRVRLDAHESAAVSQSVCSSSASGPIA